VQRLDRHELLPPSRKPLALLMLLPPSLYFTINRFDVLPALLTLVAIRLLQGNRSAAAGAALAAGAMTKWYPALLLPAFAIHLWRRDGRAPWSLLLSFVAVTAVVAAPTLWLGGIDAFLVPYRFHGARGLVTGSLPLLIHDAVRSVSGVSVDGPAYRLLFVLLQLAGLPLCVLHRSDRMESLVHCCLVAVLPFVMFSRVASPQWILWILPLALLVARSRADVAWLVIYSLATYLVYPLAWDALGEHSIAVAVGWALLFVILARLALRSLFELRADNALTAAA
jgi:hypothetical protein